VAIIDDIVKEVRKYSRRYLLERIAAITAGLDNDPGRLRMVKWPHVKNGVDLPPLDIAIATHNLATLSKIVLAHGNKWSHKVPTVEDTLRLQNHVEQLPSLFTEEPIGTVSFDEVFFQIACQQFPLQTKDERRALARALVLFQKIPALLEKDGFTLPFNLEEEFRRITGMSITRFVSSGLWLFGIAIDGRPFRLGNIDGLADTLATNWAISPEDLPTQESMQNVLDRVSRGLEEFPEIFGDLRDQDEQLIAYDYQTLLQYPLIYLGNYDYLCPVPKFLIDRITDGIFHDFSNDMAGPGGQNPFRVYFGRLFERYVREQLSLVFDSSALHPELQYGSAPDSTPDWTVSNSRTNLAVECKTSTFTLETRKSGEIERITRDITKIGAEALGKLPRKIEALLAHRTPVVLATPTHPKAVLCTFEGFEPIAMLGTMLRRATKEIIGEPADFHLVPIDYLEAMCAGGDESKFLEALDALKVDDSWGDMSTADPMPAWDSAMPHPHPRNPILEEAAGYILSIVDTRNEES